ncbi:hypothetical protein [Corynebacterium pseudopelargi]|uniref:Uncharacterized protein n=1 Tax=Corynebacterium pseudopelargi TaxID=2080757 RepID=A0A3G6ISY3_9CORY|nr:hypothetical protein [Corynebacterium pseudopelargi]AZA08703.1 hypothetical protein CPPEL_02860 [Corynebacterium pseudopelargi]
MKIRMVRGTWDQRIAPYEYVTHRPGDVVEVSDEDGLRLIQGGSAVDADAVVVEQEKPKPVKRAEKPAVVKQVPKKPRRSAPKAEWEKVATKIGVGTQRADGEPMEKNELIVAVESRLAELSD